MSLQSDTHAPFSRPPIGAQYVSRDGEIVTVAATWQQGVVFYGERCCSAQELQTQYSPLNPGTVE